MISLMNDEDNQIIKSVLKESKPKCILEVGVFSGSNTKFMREYLEDIESDLTEIICVDIAKTIKDASTINKELKIGYLSKGNFKNSKITEYYGCSLTDVFDRLPKIDLVVYDASHQAPFDILDMLLILKVLNENGTIILHDISLSLFDNFSMYAPLLVFQSFIGEKSLPNIEKSSMGIIKNIDFEKSSSSLLNAILCTFWNTNIEKYLIILERYYDISNILFALKKSKETRNIFNNKKYTEELRTIKILYSGMHNYKINL